MYDDTPFNEDPRIQSFLDSAEAICEEADGDIGFYGIVLKRFFDGDGYNIEYSIVDTTASQNEKMTCIEHIIKEDSELLPIKDKHHFFVS